MTRGAVAVTGLGAASALGTGIAAHRAAIWAGRDGIRRVARFDTARLGTHLGATWPAWDGRVQPVCGPRMDLAATAAPFPVHELALAAAREAWTSSGVAANRARVALVFGTCFGQGFEEFDALTQRIAAGLEVSGPRITISTACSSSTNAIGVARDLLLRGHVDAVVAGGADSLLREAFAGFSALGVLSSEKAAPFSEPPGTTLGEGAAFLVLERASDAAERGATSWATICGYGLSADAHHETTPHPAGDGIARAIRAALRDAGFGPADIDFVSAHATGTANNDAIEWSVIQRELGSPGRPPAVTGSKGHVGHTQGASGALELVLALLCHREGRVPPTLHFRGARAGCPADPIAQAEPREMAVSRALKLSSAFGGANAALAYACGDAAVPNERARSPVELTGAGVVGPAGAARLAGVLGLSEKRNVGPCREVDLDGLGVDGRRLDRSARWLTAAAALALAEDGARGKLERTGLFVAATRMPAQSSRRCTESIRQRGIAGTSASAFARMSVNAPTGACTLALGLLGPTSTFSMGEGSGLLAVLLAAEWLAYRDDAASIVAGAVDEPSGRVPDEAEGAVCLVLKRSTGGERGAIVVAAWAIAGPGSALEAADRAMSGRARVDAVVVDAEASVVARLEPWVAPGRGLGVIDGSLLWGAAEATRGGVMAAVAAAHVAAGHADSILVVSARGASSVAVVLERGRPG
jgi:3-oxoacyl-[acyl-carrier-protein] synthase II